MSDAKGLGIPAKILLTLRNADDHIKLPISPNELDPVSIFLIICLFIARTLKHALGLGTPFSLLKDGVDEFKYENLHHEQLFTLPGMSLSMPLRCTSEHRRTFKDAVGAPRDDQYEAGDSPMNNVQLCLYLAALTEPAMLILLGKRGCPVRPLGAVNVRNRFELLDPKLCKTLFDGKSDSRKGVVSPTASTRSSLSVLAQFSGPARRVRRGIEIVVEVNIIATKASTTAEAHPSTTTSTAIFRQEFTMLQFMKFSTKSLTFDSNGTTKPQTSSSRSENKQDTFLSTPIPTKAPYTWAILCKDYNPIHFSPTLAKLLGQPGQLAHGNHAVGICIESLNQLLDQNTTVPSATQHTVEDMTSAKRLLHNMTENTKSSQSRWWMEVQFRRPIVLPATVGPKIYKAGDGFDVVDGRTGKVGVEVTVGSID